MEIIDNFLKKEDFGSVKDNLLGYHFPWFYSKKTIDENEDLFSFQFFHIFYSNYSVQSQMFSLIYPVIEKINPLALIKVKANLGTITDSQRMGGWHCDFEGISCKTAVYYVNTNNGGTRFEDGTFIDSVENRLVVFDNEMRHTSVSQTDTQVRSVININYVPNVDKIIR